MKIFDAIVDYYNKIFARKVTARGREGRPENHPKKQEKVYFESVTIVEKTPKNDFIKEKEFVTVVYNNKPMWALFRCPCKCSQVISLSLQSVHRPSWTVTKSPKGRPTLHPSVWQNNGCCSHFWIKDGRVYWCGSSGVEPYIADPEYYSKPKKFYS